MSGDNPLIDELPVLHRLALSYAPSSVREATLALLVLDAWRFKRNATAAANALSATMADGIRANLIQKDALGVAETLNTAHLQP